MNEIAKRLHEQHRVEQAKSILESAGYTVTKEEKLKESAKIVYDTLVDLGIDYGNISEEEDGTVIVDSGSKPFSPQEMKKVYNSIPTATGAGMEDQNHTMWFTF